jgi:hypothetical protein
MGSGVMTKFGLGRSALVRSMLLLIAMHGATSATAMDWPQEIVADAVTIVVYQPQPDKLKGNVLSARAAMSLEADNLAEPIFGAFWFEAKIDTDRDAGTAMIRDVKVTNVRWPDSRDADEQRFTAIVEAAVPASGFEISLERLTASLESAEIERESLEQIRNDPPIIEFRETLAVLLIYDGEPRYSDVDNSDYERVLNTPFVVVRKKQSDEYWLSSGKFWYSATNPMGPWTPSSSPPRDLTQMVQSAEVDGEQPESPPAIVAASQPTELIVTQGAPDWQSLPGGELLYVQNTETPWLRDLPTGNMYVLLSGRWFRANSKDGPWTFVRADELPTSFADIPPASDIGGLRASVAGTDEAQEAVLDAQIPQTAAIKRDEATLTVEYDGAPSFEDIPGTSVAYAVNTGAQVLEIDNRFYAVDNGVWFTSTAATGPWAVADSIPSDEIDKIPPSSPVYNTTHVHIYESTPEVVYVGYTPGYLWSFPYYGVPIYGTGWNYPPYYGRWYYPRPPTWGFHVGYNPWTGWNFGMSWSNGFFTLGMSWGGGWGGAYRPWGCCGGWYGGGYRGPVVINTGDINIGNNVNIGNRTNIGNRIDRDTNLNLDRSRANIYNRPEARDRLADSNLASRELQRARPATSRENNVFADRDGNVARKVGNDWQTRENGQWNRADAGSAARDRAASIDQQRARSTATSRAQSFDRSSLDRANHSRQVGASRQMARPTAMRGGGGRRRR